MVEIIPNWHPIFVHFTVGLFSTAAGFYVLVYLSNYLQRVPITLVAEFEVVARYCLWVAAIFSIMTVIAGFDAYSTVRHDTVSHAAMTNHRNWALPTATAIILLSIWSVWRYYKHRVLTFTFIIPLLIVQGLLLSTAWRGAELVFRYGLGVISLPQGEKIDPQSEGTMENRMRRPSMPIKENHGQHEHAE